MRHISQALMAMMISLVPAAWSFGQQNHAENPEVKALTERVDRLEKTVIRDAYHPDETVLARLKTVEDRLNTADKAGAVATKAETRGDDQVKRSLDALTAQIRDMDQRLRRAETADRREEPRNDADLREIKSSLSQLNRSVSDLQERVRRLEAKR